eukprot:SAG11_NODE_142_length_14906_cov_8.352333_7_plen_181_part_00
MDARAPSALQKDQVQSALRRLINEHILVLYTLPHYLPSPSAQVENMSHPGIPSSSEASSLLGAHTANAVAALLTTGGIAPPREARDAAGHSEETHFGLSDGGAAEELLRQQSSALRKLFSVCLGAGDNDVGRANYAGAKLAGMDNAGWLQVRNFALPPMPFGNIQSFCSSRSLPQAWIFF